MIRGRLGIALVPHISDVARVGIGNVVGNNLGAAIGKSNTVLASGGVVVTVLVGSEVGASVVISNSIAVLVHRGSIISGLMVRRSRLVSRGGVVRSRGRLVRSGLVSRGRVVRSGSRLVDRGGLVGRGGVVRSRGRVVGSGGRVVSSTMGSMDRLVGRGVGSSHVLLLVVGLVHLVGLGRGLAHHLGVVRAMGLVHSGGDSRGIAVLDALVVRLVGRSQSQDRKDGDKSLKALEKLS